MLHRGSSSLALDSGRWSIMCVRLRPSSFRTVGPASVVFWNFGFSNCGSGFRSRPASVRETLGRVSCKDKASNRF